MAADALAAADRRWRRDLEQRLTLRPETGRAVAARDLATVLHDVLADAGKPGTDAAETLVDVWQRAGAPERALSWRAYAFHAYLVGAFGTEVGIALGLDSPEREQLAELFRGELTSIGNRLFTRRPGARVTRWHLRRYAEACGGDPAGAASFVPVAERFAEACAEVAADAGAFAEARDRIALAGLELFHRAAAGTVTAVRSWRVE